MESNRKTAYDEQDSFSNYSDATESDPSVRRKERKRRKKRRKEERKRDRKRSATRKRRSREDESEIESEDLSSGDSYDEDFDSSRSYHRTQKRKHKKKKSKKRKRKEMNRSREEVNVNQHERNHELVNNLVELFTYHPGMSDQLPILLVRLCSGTTFSLEQSQVREPLEKVLQCLFPFGVYKDETGSYAWKHDPLLSRSFTVSSTSQHSELSLVRVVRSLLDDIGLTASTVLEYEQGRRRNHSQTPTTASSPHSAETTTESHTDLLKDIPRLVHRILTTSPKVEKELVEFAEMILQGETVSLDRLKSEQSKGQVSQLFEMCQLKRIESTGEVGIISADNVPIGGYSLPETDSTCKKASDSLKLLIQTCQSKSVRVLGPMRPPPGYNERTASDDEDEEGPQLTPADHSSNTLDENEIKALARQRLAEVERAKAGLDPSFDPTDGNGREEWMLVPGQYDFVDALKASGSNMRNRQFQNTKTGENDKDEVPQMDPQVKAEMNKLMLAHQQSRGASLMEEHQAEKRRKQEEMQQQEKASGQKSSSWKWNRSQDLDAGRRVDNAALQNVLGGASSGLKTKFQGGFHSSR